MSDPSPARALRLMLSVTRRLRELADDASTIEADRELFLTAATALEARAKWMATSLPGDRCEPALTVHLHKPVNLVI